jgi:hypothetical protein
MQTNTVGLYEAMRIFDTEIQALRDTLELKNSDYANIDDMFANFNKVACMNGTSPRHVFLTMIGVKVARLAELSSGKHPKNEAMEDSIKDLMGYSILWKIWEKVNGN